MQSCSLPRVAALFCTMVFAGSAVAQTPAIEFPPFLIEQEAASGQATVVREMPRVYQSYLDEQILTSVTQPVFITGMQFRLAIGNRWRGTDPNNSGNSWPRESLTFPEYQISMGRASPAVASAGWFGTTSVSFDANMVGAQTVRTGPLTIAANSYLATGGSTGVHAWGPLISFDSWYRYNPGETIVWMLRHPGHGRLDIGANFASRFAAPNFTAGLLATGTANAVFPTALADVFYVRFTTRSIPEPAAALLASAMLTSALMRRRQTHRISPTTARPASSSPDPTPAMPCEAGTRSAH